MSKKRNQIIISTASVAAALQAVAGANHESRPMMTTPEEAFRAEIGAAMAGSQAQAAVRMSTLPILNGIRVNPTLLESNYAEIAEGEAGASDKSGTTPETDTTKKKEKIKIDVSMIDAFTRDGDGAFTESKAALLTELGLTVPEGETLDEYFARVSAAVDKMADAIAEGADVEDPDVAYGTTTGHLKDSTIAKDYLSCYSNCHSACHGARGWR